MAQGRGSANRALVLGLALLCVLALAQPSLAAVYNVGGSAGWTFNVANWARGKTFRAGDVLVFRYNRSLHNVVPVSGSMYYRCRSPRGARAYNSGKDIIRLRRGVNYFICSAPGHCKAGMKIAVKAY